MDHDQTEKAGVRQDRLQLVLFSAALGPLLLTVALLVLT